MQMRAIYLGVDEPTLDRLIEMDPDAVVAELERLEPESDLSMHLNTSWDGLHFLLTGSTAADPLEEHPLSEAVVGVHVFDSEEYVGCTEHDELPRLIAELEKVDADAVFAAPDFGAFAKAEVYPEEWSGDPQELAADLRHGFDELVTFHQQCREAGLHLVVSIR